MRTVKHPKKNYILILIFLLVISLSAFNFSSSQLSAAAKPETPNDNSLLLIINALEERILALETSNLDLIGRVSTLETAGLELSSKVTSLEASYLELSGKVASLEASNLELAGEVASLKTTNLDLSERVSALEGNQSIGSSNLYLERNGVIERTTETRIGNLIADAYRNVTGADVAIVNGGSIRAPIMVGDFTFSDLHEVLPFDNKIVVKEIPGGEIWGALESGIRDVPLPYGGFPQVSGLSFTYDPSQPQGLRVLSVSLNGTSIDVFATYKCAISSYIAAGGDGYNNLIPYPVVEEFSTEAEVLADYIQTLPFQTITDEYAPLEGRITVITP
jgi:2',3'-cyclic-nucleotide 2'-phosphodiesterase (5'-nucleotidase family)